MTILLTILPAQNIGKDTKQTRIEYNWNFRQSEIKDYMVAWLPQAGGQMSKLELFIGNTGFTLHSL